MPIYAYRCEDCGHAQDFLQKMSDPLIDTCPNCGSKNFRKQLTAAGFQLKGGGWYVTDFRDNGKKDGKKPGEPATAVAPAGSGGEAKGDGGGAKSDTTAAAPAPAAPSSSSAGSGSSASSTPAAPSGGAKST